MNRSKTNKILIIQLNLSFTLDIFGFNGLSFSVLRLKEK